MGNPINLSIIVAAYNSEDNISYCLESLHKLTRHDIEFIIVNDGSVDRTAIIADNYAVRDNRFKIYSQENQGVSCARNLGLKKSSGTYICFLDSDDCLCSDFDNILLNNALNENYPDVIWFGIQKINDYNNAFIDDKINVVPIGSDDFEHLKGCTLYYDYRFGENSHLMQGISVSTAGGVAYRRFILTNNHIVFNENVKWLEDGIFNFEALRYCNSGIYIKAKIYFYYQRLSSLSNNIVNNVISNCAKRNIQTENILEKVYNISVLDYGNIFIQRYLASLIWQIAEAFEKEIFNFKNHISIYKRRRLYKEIMNSEIYITAIKHCDKNILAPNEKRILKIAGTKFFMVSYMYYFLKMLRSLLK